MYPSSSEKKRKRDFQDPYHYHAPDSAPQNQRQYRQQSYGEPNATTGGGFRPNEDPYSMNYSNNGNTFNATPLMLSGEEGLSNGNQRHSSEKSHRGIPDPAQEQQQQPQGNDYHGAQSHNYQPYRGAVGGGRGRGGHRQWRGGNRFHHAGPPPPYGGGHAAPPGPPPFSGPDGQPFFGGPPPLKRQRREPPPTVALSSDQRYAIGLKQLIATIGDELTNIKHDIQKLIADFAKDRDLEKYGDLLHRAFVACIEIFPAKSAVYANLLAEINRVRDRAPTDEDNQDSMDQSSEEKKPLSVIHSEFVRGVLNEACRRVNFALSRSKFLVAKIWLRFLAQCANCQLIDMDNFISTVQSLLERISDEDSLLMQEQLVYLSIVLCAHIAPKCVGAHKKDESHESAFENLLVLLDQQMQQVKASSLATQEMKRVIRNDSYISDAVQARYNQFKAYQSNQWINVVYAEKHYIFSLFDSLEDDYPTYSIDPLNVNTPLADGVQFKSSLYARLGLFEVLRKEDESANEDSTAQTRPHSSLSQKEFDHTPAHCLLFVEDYINDLLYICQDKVDEFLQQSLSLFSHEEDEDHDTRIPRHDHVVIDVVLGHLLNAPQAQYSPLFFTAFSVGLLYDTNDEKYGNMKRLITRYVEILFELVPQMALDTQYALMRWFTLHVANFGNRWQWQMWEPLVKEYTSLSEESNSTESENSNDDSTRKNIRARAQFLANVFADLQRLSGVQAIESCIPRGFAPILPKMPSPNYSYASPQHKHHKTAGELNQLLKRNPSNDEVLQRLNELSTADDSELSSVSERVFFFTQVFLVCFSKSTEDTAEHVQQFAETFENLTGSSSEQQEAEMDTEEGELSQVSIVKSISSYWSNNPLRCLLTLQAFLQHNIIKAEHIFEWLFSNRDTLCSVQNLELIRYCIQYLYDSCLHCVAQKRDIRQAPLKEKTSYANQTLPSKEQLEQRNPNEWPSFEIFFLLHFENEEAREAELERVDQTFKHCVKRLHDGSSLLLEKIQQLLSEASNQNDHRPLNQKEEAFILAVIRDNVRLFAAPFDDGQFVDWIDTDAGPQNQEEAMEGTENFIGILREGANYFSDMARDLKLSEEMIDGKQADLWIREALVDAGEES